MDSLNDLNGTARQRMRTAYSTTAQRGFTLVESVLVMVILAILFCLAVPALNGLLARQRLTTAQADLIAALQHARGLAATSRRRILFCPSRDGQRCADDTHWEKGWIIGPYRSSNAEQLDGLPLRVHDDYAGLIITSTSGRKRIRFQPDGTSGGSTVTFILCRPGHAEDALAIKLSNVGRVVGAKVAADEAAQCANGS